MKCQIKAELAFHNIRLYPYESEEDEEQEKALNESIFELIPFAVVGSERNVVIDGKAVRGRKTRWGAINGKSLCVCVCVSWWDASDFFFFFFQSKMPLTVNSFIFETF